MTAPKPRFIVPKPLQVQATVIQTSSKPELGHLLEDGLSIMQTEILKLKRIANGPGGLSVTQANMLQGYLTTLVKMEKSLKEKQADEDASMADLSPEQLLAAMEAETEALRSTIRGAKK